MEIQQQPQLDAIRAEAQQRYERALALADSAKHQAHEAVLAMADVGALLELGWEAMRAQVGSRESMAESWGIDRDHAVKAAYLHRNREQLELELWPQDVAKIGARFVGLLPPTYASSRPAAEERRGSGSHWISYASKLHTSVTKLFDDRPLTKWRDDERDNMRKALRPIVELYEKLS